jgi:hypothetical protein
MISSSKTVTLTTWKVNRAFARHAKGFLFAIDRVHPCDSIILVESYFRPFSFRIAEYLYFALLRLLSSRKSHLLTLGLNQLTAGEWIIFLQSRNCAPTFFQIIRACENLSLARQATQQFLRARVGSKGLRLPSEIYTGGANAYYDHLARCAAFILEQHWSVCKELDKSDRSRPLTIRKEQEPA